MPFAVFLFLSVKLHLSTTIRSSSYLLSCYKRACTATNSLFSVCVHVSVISFTPFIISQPVLSRDYFQITPQIQGSHLSGSDICE